MTTKKKILIAAVVVVAISVDRRLQHLLRATAESLRFRSGRVVRQDLTQTVSANGEIKPKKYVNISSNMMGRIVRLPVKEGDHVRDGELLVQLESIQTEADVQSAEASLDAAQAEVEGMVGFDSIRAKRRSIRRRRKSRDPKRISRARSRTSIAPSRMSKEGLIAQGSIRTKPRPTTTLPRLR